MNMFKRITAGVLSALTVIGSFPAAGAAPAIELLEDGRFRFPIMRAEEDNQPSEAEIRPQERYTVWDNGGEQATFLQDGGYRNVWSMHFKMSDGVTARVYCKNHDLTNPGSREFEVDGLESDKRLYGIAIHASGGTTPPTAFVNSSDQFMAGASTILSDSQFQEWEYYCASQAAIWAALGQLKILPGNIDGVSWPGSEALGYHDTSGKVLTANGPKSALTLYAACVLLQAGNSFNDLWGPSGKNRLPISKASFSHCAGLEEYDSSSPSRKYDQTLSIPKGTKIADSNVFTLQTIDGQECYVLPMAIASSTFIRGQGEDNRPTVHLVMYKDETTPGIFLIDENGTKSNAVASGDTVLSLHEANKNNELFENENEEAWGEKFKLCIPKSIVDEIDADTTSTKSLKLKMGASMNVDRYEIYSTHPVVGRGSVQDGLMIAPLVKTITTNFQLSSEPNQTTEKYSRLKVLKTGENNAPLAGAKIQIEYTDPKTNQKISKIETTDTDGKAVFGQLPVNTDITVTELEAPPGYEKILEPKTVNSGNGEGEPVTCTIENMKTDTVGLKIIKKDAEDASKPLQGAKFKVEYMDGATPKTLTGETDASGSLSFTGLPLGAEVTITETDPPAGYELMSPNPVTKTLPTTPGGTRVAEYTFTDQETKEDGELKIRKVDSDTGANLAGASFKLEQIDGSFVTSVGPTDASGIVTIDGESLPNGSYKVTEINAPDGYVLNPEAQTFQWNNEEGQEVTITFKDYKKGTLELFKYDAVTHQGLGGATFELRKDGKVIDTLHTDETGHASKSGLAEGYYQLVEVNPPAGYLKDAKVYEVYIDPEDTAEVVRKINIPNYSTLGIRVIKVDNGTSVPLKGFTFELYKGTILVTSGTTDDNGEIMFTDLEPGDYRVREAGGTEDYAVDAPDQFVTLVKDESEIPTLTFRNDKKRDYRIKKVDAETGAAIPGVVFEIFRDGQSLGQLPPTDANGEVQLEHTEFGTYNVKEVTVPPEYVKSDETFIMEIDKDTQDPFVFTIPNQHKKKLTLKKIDAETGLPMSGVTFDVYLNNNKIGSKTTTNGEIVIKTEYKKYYT